MGWYCCDRLRAELADRIRDGECAIVHIPGSLCRANGTLSQHYTIDWCVTHNTEQNPGHAFDRGGLATLD